MSSFNGSRSIVGSRGLALVLSLSPITLVTAGAQAPATPRSNDSVVSVCRMSFEAEKTSMPASEVEKFCACVSEDVTPRLDSYQLGLVHQATQPQKLSRRDAEDLATTLHSAGVRDVIVAAQARCSDALYSVPRALTLKSADGSELALFCHYDLAVPTASFSRPGLVLATEDEILDGLDNSSAFPVVQVTWQIDDNDAVTEYWDCNLEGNGVDAGSAGHLIRALREGNRLQIRVSRDAHIHTAVFDLSGKVPRLWDACPH